MISASRPEIRPMPVTMPAAGASPSQWPLAAGDGLQRPAAGMAGAADLRTPKHHVAERQRHLVSYRVQRLGAQECGLFGGVRGIEVAKHFTIGGAVSPHQSLERRGGKRRPAANLASHVVRE